MAPKDNAQKTVQLKAIVQNWARTVGWTYKLAEVAIEKQCSQGEEAP